MTSDPDREWFVNAIEELARLDERQAAVLRRRFLEGMSVEETADELEVSPRSVRTDSRIGYNWLRKKWDDESKSI